MAPDAEYDGEVAGFKRGFKLQAECWLSDFQTSHWNEYICEKEENKLKFKVGYSQKYSEGKAQRQETQQAIKFVFGNTTKSEKVIHDILV
ncbi:MAG: hypothetical protein AAF740_12875, partial [Bacteroidota bacterium]